MGDARFESALAHHRAGKFAEAEKVYRALLAEDGRHQGALQMLGVLTAQTNRLAEAEQLIRRALELRPNSPEAMNNLGNVLKATGRFDEAIGFYRRAIALSPNFVDAHNNLGTALREARRLDEAIAAYREAIRLRPNYAEAHSNLGIALSRKGLLDEAIAAYQQAIRLQPNLAAPHSNLGNALVRLGLAEEAIACYRRAIALNPDFVDAHSNLVKTLHSHPAYDAKMIQQELTAWSARHAEPLRRLIQPHGNLCDPERRLRIGYVSAVFFQKSLGQSILPLLKHHDRRQFEVFCYSSGGETDALTDKLQGHAEPWRDIAAVPDAQAAQQIRQDGIDILVDLMLHSANNRLLLFAHEPAPIQLTYLGYCSSSGLSSMDYRLSDPYLDPPEADISVYTEKTIRLPQTYWCYNPPDSAPEVVVPPAAKAKHITFGSLNSYSKVSRAMLELWGKVMQATPNSRMIIHALASDRANEVLHRFMAQGIGPERIEFVGWQPQDQYLNTYSRIDVVLDTHPWTGGITSCDALYMGVPVVTLTGSTAVSRGTSSVLHNIALEDLIARSPQQYVQIAAALAQDLPRLEKLRRELRDRMRNSPLMNAEKITRDIETIYREIWRDWCQGDSVS
jgi:predicted O-linked N-acetylglucosamine transferase (SPINDLY family)